MSRSCNYIPTVPVTPEALDLVFFLIIIKRYAQKILEIFRYFSYRNGITGRLAEFSVKNINHIEERVPDSIYNELELKMVINNFLHICFEYI